MAKFSTFPLFAGRANTIVAVRLRSVDEMRNGEYSTQDFRRNVEIRVTLVPAAGTGTMASNH